MLFNFVSFKYITYNKTIVPPHELCQAIFPWVEDELAAYQSCLDSYGPKASDYALNNFLTLLIELQTVLLQDAAVLYVEYLDHHLWQYPPFNSTAFREFDLSSTVLMEVAAAAARHQLEALPQIVKESLKGIVQTMYMQQDQVALKIENNNDYMRSLVFGQLSGSSIGGRYASMFLILLLIALWLILYVPSTLYYDVEIVINVQLYW